MLKFSLLLLFLLSTGSPISYWLSVTTTLVLYIFILVVQFHLTKFKYWTRQTHTHTYRERAIDSFWIWNLLYWHLVNVKIDFISSIPMLVYVHWWVLLLQQSILLNFKRIRVIGRRSHTHVICTTYHMIKCRADYRQTHIRKDLYCSYSNQIALRMDRMCANVCNWNS